MSKTNKLTNIFLQSIATKMSGILKENFIGFYVYGSFARDSWNPVKSDIDFIVVTKTPINKNHAEQICQLHNQLNSHPINKKLEGEYIDFKSLQNQEFNKLCIVVEDGKCLIDSLCQLSADNLFDLINYGKLIDGEPIVNLNIQISENNLLEAMNDALLEDQQKLATTDSFEALYKILINVLRSIYTIKNKQTPTKKMAIEFNKDLLPIDLYNNIQAYNENKINSFEIDKSFISSLIERFKKY